MNEELEKKEETKIDNLDATLASPEAVEPEKAEPEETPAPALDTNPIPTPEEKEEAGISAPESDEPVQSEPAESEIVSSEPTEPEVPESSEPEKVEVREELGVTDMPARTFSQEEVNDIAGKTRAETRNKTFQYIYDRYGVEDEAGLDELVGNAQRYDSLNEQYESDRKSWSEQSAARDKELADIKEQVALMQSGIDSTRYEDAKLILKGKGLDVSLENINAEMATHPEWSKKPAEEEKPFEKVAEPSISTPNEPVTKLSVLGNEPEGSGVESEEEQAMKMFRI
jgi:hypothetical protein